MNFISDLWYIVKGKFRREKIVGQKFDHEYRYGFLVHARGHKDMYRKYPGLRWVPKPVLLFVMNNLWPVTLSRITGLGTHAGGPEIPGYVFGITMTADEMMRKREKSLRKIRHAMYLARGRGVSLVGLGGLTASLSGGGKHLLDIPINITTGHAYTAFNIVQNVLKITDILNIPKEHLRVAVVGAAGSVGSVCAQLLARDGYRMITLIDLKRKHSEFDVLQKAMYAVGVADLRIKISDSIGDTADCDIIITATNTPEALITTDLVRSGQIFIDDAQPSDIHPDVLKMPDILVLEAGVVHTPGINSNFNYGLKSRTDNFCCMAELLVLASREWDDHYVIHRATLAHVDEISSWRSELGFEVAAFQNFLETISPDKIEHIRTIVRDKHGLSS